MKGIAYLDIETSGFDPQEDDIIRYRVILIDNDGETEVIDKLAKPRKLLSVVVEELTKITNEQLSGCEPSEAVKEEILTMLDNRIIIGNNISIIEMLLGMQFENKIDLSDKIWAEDKHLSKKDFFSLEKAERVDYMIERIDEYRMAYEDKYGFEIFHSRISEEIIRIRDLDLVEYFVVSSSLAEILEKIDYEPHFIGVGCSSLMAHCLRISEEWMNPIDSCLIFERAFGEGQKNTNAFNFFIPSRHIPQVQQQLQSLYGSCEIVDIGDNKRILKVHDVEIKLIVSLRGFDDGIGDFDDFVDMSTVAVFQEDYMRLLHLVGKFSYDEANQIRIDIGKRNTKKIEEHKNHFIQNTCTDLPLFESQRLFDDIEKGLFKAHCKAWHMSIGWIRSMSIEDMS